MKPNLVLYHAGCYDGFTAAWIAREYLGAEETECVPVQYGDDPPPCAGQDVYIVDFSFPREVLDGIWKQARSLVVLDHHKTAKDELEDLPYATFDMTKSGARLAWEYFFRSMPVPKLVQYVEDRDLWKWELPHSKTVNAYLRSFDFEFETWSYLNLIGLTSAEVLNEGLAILRNEGRVVEYHVCEALKYPFELDGHSCPIINATCLQSEIAGKIAELNPEGIGACFRVTPRGEQIVSLRSRDGGPDVSAIAKKFGGGGHPTAAGFKLQKGDWIV